MKRIIPLICCTAILFAFSLVFSGNGMENKLNPDESAAVKQACLDYVEGFFESDSQRITMGVHPELHKRRVRAGNLDGVMTRPMPISAAESAKRTKPQITVEVYDIYDGIALAKVTSGFVDYCQLGKIDGRWQVVNVLWCSLIGE